MTPLHLQVRGRPALPRKSLEKTPAWHPQGVWRTDLGLCLHLQVREDLQRVQAGYRLLQRQPLVRRHNVTLEQYQWAVATCRSRSFAIPQAREWLVRPTGCSCAVGCEGSREGARM